MVSRFKIDDVIYEIDIQKNKNGDYSVTYDKKIYQFNFIPLNEHCGSILINNAIHKIFYGNINKKTFIFIHGETFELEESDPTEQQNRTITQHDRLGSRENKVFAPMPGKILKFFVTKNQAVRANDSLFIIESMKMENEILSPITGKINKINYGINAIVSSGDLIIEMAPEEVK